MKPAIEEAKKSAPKSKSTSRGESELVPAETLSALKVKVASLQKAQSRKGKKESDPSKPLRVRGACIQFITEQILSLKAQQAYAAQLASKEIKHADIVEIATAAWGKLTPAQKTKYEKQEADKARHTRETTEWTPKGYYIKTDGNRSAATVKASTATRHSASLDLPKKVYKKKKPKSAAKNKAPKSKDEHTLSDEL